MAPAFWILFSVIFVVLLITNNVKFSKTQRLKQSSKHVEEEKSASSVNLTGSLRLTLEISKLAYFSCIKGIPNYEAMQRLLASIGNNSIGYLSINVVFLIMLGRRNPFDEALVTKLITSITQMNKKMSPVVSVLEIIPFLRHFPKLTFLGDLHETSNMIYDILREVIAEKRRVGKYSEHVEDFVDGWLQHLDKSENLEDGLNEENMLVVLRDMLFAGADTTSATLEHALLFMTLHPEVQERIQIEIDNVVGQDRTPVYEDRRRMPYTEATLHEIYRLASRVPGIARTKHHGNDCSFAPILLYGIHRNELFFDDPNEFNLERFLDKEDPTKVVNTENVMAFGYGRRSCPGETAARVAVFIYFVVMLKKYSIRLSAQHPPPSMRNTHGFSRSLEHYYVTIRRRS